MERNHKSKFYTAKRLRVLDYLTSKGFNPIKTIPDPNNPKYKWWLFDNTEELQKEVENYFKNSKKEKQLN